MNTLLSRQHRRRFAAPAGDASLVRDCGMPQAEETSLAKRKLAGGVEAGRPKTSRLASACFLLSLLSLAGWLVTSMPLPLLGAIGIGIGLYSLWAIRRSQGRLQGREVAVAGIWAGLLKLAMVGALFVAAPKQTFQSFG